MDVFRKYRHREVTVSAVAGLVLSLAAGPSLGTTPPVTTTWQVETAPDPSTQLDEFAAVAGVAGATWAVGDDAGPTFVRTLIARRTSTGWVQVPSPNRNTWQNNYLTGVAVTSRTNAWAVGYLVPPLAVSQAHPYGVIMLHWDGTAWTRQAAPQSSVESNVSPALHGVAALSSSSAWAVGVGLEDGSETALVEHWDGTAWRVQPTPGGGALSGVVAVDGTHQWAVGAKGRWPFLLRGSGSTWTAQTPPHPGTSADLSGVDAVSTSNVWAVGSFTNDQHQVRTLVLHYDGSQWRRVASPNVGSVNNVLTGVHAIAADDIWAVGHDGSKPLIEHYDGVHWTVDSATTGGTLVGVGGGSGVNVVGHVSADHQVHTLALHHD
jgi:hypothetical protein